ncbi:MAG: hypothetical protein B7X36_08815 [Thiomonas sp. 14-64-326]|nr:MAG: hypothetical protein B7X36_08815 [Thiomonas sp. 14-64-326]
MPGFFLRVDLPRTKLRFWPVAFICGIAGWLFASMGRVGDLLGMAGFRLDQQEGHCACWDTARKAGWRRISADPRLFQ